MALEWSQSLSVGNNEIDTQHIELFKIVNDFISAMRQQKGKEEIGRVIKFLEAYVTKHFSMEENYMAQVKYPGILSHKKEHALFIVAFSEIKKKYTERGAGLDVIIQANSKLGDWLRRHIPVTDKAMAEFLRSNI